MINTYIVDAFTDKPFKGNPAGVCILISDLEDSKMLSIAKEFEAPRKVPHEVFSVLGKNRVHGC